MSDLTEDDVGGFFGYAVSTVEAAGFSGYWVTGFAGAVGLLFDGLLEATRQAVKLRFPSICPPDALDPNGSTFGLPRYPFEADDAYRARLGHKWRTHEESGSKYGINRAFAAAGLNAVLYESWEWDDGQDPTAAWYRVYVVLPLDRTDRVVPLWGDPGLWGDGGAWEDGRQREVEVVRAILRQHKPAHAVVSGIFVSLAGGYWGLPGDTWGYGPDDLWGTDRVQRVAF